MSALPPAIKGWCPGALRPMATGDGWLARVRVSAGRLSLDQAEALAEGARACGNGGIEISSRGNLQLRGIREAALPDLRARLSDLGLLDFDSETERLRNIVASSLADLDPEALFDVAPVVAEWERRLASDVALRKLPSKFSFVIDAGGRFPLGDVDADVRFEAAGSGFAVKLAGDAAAAGVRPESFPEVAARLVRTFFALAGDGSAAPRRMRALVNRDGAHAVFAAAGLAAKPFVASRAISPREVIGLITFPTQTCLGVAPPFGRTDARALTGFVRAARRNGAGGVRLTPWRAMIAIGLDAKGAARLARDIADIGFIVSADDPRLGVVACPGAPACAHAARDTRADALALAHAIRSEGGIFLHVSGCAKGCARGSSTPFTLAGRPAGYDLILNGRAGDEPAYRNLSPQAAAALIQALSQGRAA